MKKKKQQKTLEMDGIFFDGILLPFKGQSDIK